MNTLTLLTLFSIFSVHLAFDASIRTHERPHLDVEHKTDHWVMKLKDNADPWLIASRHGHEYCGQVLDGYHMFTKKSTTLLGATHPHHNESKEIEWHENQIARQRQKRSSILDPLYPVQWHLKAESSGTNVHVNAEKVWSMGITGKGVTIAVVDDGLQYDHPDIQLNYNEAGSFDFNYNDPNPYPDSQSDDHGTSAGGVAAARDNNVCGVGAAYKAGLSGIRVISKTSTDVQEAGALNYQPQINDIYTNSWGPTDDGRRKEGPGTLATAAIEKGIKEGRSKKGSIFIWAAGNGRRSGDNCNYDGWANSRYTVSIAAVDHVGIQAPYSESCSMLVVSAPSSGSGRAITTTDLLGPRGTSRDDCTSTFGGTSAAAPLAAGIAALILEANPELTWRDLQGVLIESAIKNDPLESGWIMNGAGYSYNHRYGFGLIDAYRAVKMAKRWKGYPEANISNSTKSEEKAIKDGVLILSEIKVEATMIVEHAEVYFLATHQRRGDLQIVLVSPSGTRSILAEPHNDLNQDYNWRFGSIVNWGEKSNGTWKLEILDGKTDKEGIFKEWKLVLYGRTSE